MVSGGLLVQRKQCDRRVREPQLQDRLTFRKTPFSPWSDSLLSTDAGGQGNEDSPPDGAQEKGGDATAQGKENRSWTAFYQCAGHARKNSQSVRPRQQCDSCLGRATGYKGIFGNAMKARALTRQKSEAWFSASALNRITSLGMPVSGKI